MLYKPFRTEVANSVLERINEFGLVRQSKHSKHMFHNGLLVVPSNAQSMPIK